MLIVLCAGCGKERIPGRPELFPVKGVVTFAGTPVSGAKIVFSPSTHDFAATAKTDESGKFQLQSFEPNDGAAEGDYRILVYKVDVHELPGGGVREEHHLPARYRDPAKSGLIASVSSSQENVVQIDLRK
ncbi:hypothetical protein [Planctomicrobium sp. SH527]|uniref:hypothetical protein n=1 Tax=Planctomicrobium sp. SH527 TaxID=3448123 RepID=UPI003F5AF15F